SFEINIQAIDHWSTDARQDAWFSACSLHSVIENLDIKPKWISIISDNGPHYHNSELMVIMSKWYEWYGIQVKKWIFLEAGEAKTTVDSHHAQISLSIKRYIRIGGEIQEGSDITSAIKNIAGTSVAHIEPNQIKENKGKSMTIPGISNWFEWTWPIEGEDAGYIKARAMPNVGKWTLFSPAHIQKLLKGEINQPSPQVSETTKPKSPWKIPIPHSSGICPKRLPLQELTNELQNRKVDYGNQNKRQKLVEILDKELTHETLEKKESCLRNRSMLHKEYTTRLSDITEFPLSSGWAMKEVQKYGKKGGGKRIKKSISAVLEESQEGEIESSDIPKVTTIQGWITRYAAQLREKSAQTVLEEA
ncbi:hypothetical protein RhiirA5_431343, partial [Rhizophagus irregularis]